MKIYSTLILLISLSFDFTLTNAQDISSSTITWNADKVVTFPKGDIALNPGALVTYGNRVEIKDNTGSITKSYTMRNAYGTLTNLSQSGSIRYAILSADRKEDGILMIEKSESETTIKIVLQQTPVPSEVRYHISRYSVQQ